MATALGDAQPSAPVCRPDAVTLLGGHEPALDGVRGLAVLGVMASHLFYGTPHGWASGAALRVLAFGATGVDVFFALSGFLITGILFDSLGDQGYFRKFYIRRALRILPLYYGVLLIVWAVQLAGKADYGRQLASLALFLQNSHRIAEPIWRYHGASPLPLVHFWSLAVEEQFYLVWPLCVFLLRGRERVFRACVIGVVFSVGLRCWLRTRGVPYEDLHEMTLCRLDVLLAGGALAMTVRGAGRNRAFEGALGAFAIAAAIGFLQAQLAPGPLHEAVRFTLLSLMYAMGAALVVAAALLPEGRMGRAMSWRPMRVLGRYSYGLYVWQYIVAGLLRDPIDHALRTGGVQSAELAVVLTGLALAAVSFALAWASYEFYERRFLRLKRLFRYDVQPRARELG